MKKIILSYSLVIVSFAVFLYGCSEVKNGITVVAPTSGIHGAGWVDPSSANFHGNALKATGFNLKTCKSCHGGDYSGGTSGISCLTCHSNGPETCNLCHGNEDHINPPKAINGNILNTDLGVGAHVKHLTSDTTQRISAVVECSECHTQVNSFSDSNHIQNNQLIATINFGPLARTITAGVTPNPQWNRATQTCSNVYCHGAFNNGNQNSAPVFNNPGSVYCGTCHGDPTTGNPLPGGTHPTFYPNLNQCYLCHGGVINQNGTFKDKSRHINGIVDFSK